ncbi:hypothetical protein HJG60_009740 [Phyllostomus discolor]|uniref:Uncharacterized protein n=1 Tax=Phyllostomus discolor TaxID=89673 RepID=A0A834B9W5_9CHIR|nr:hypothetical protein HJG60_009740 [Phyllostomus discolor]
MSSLVSGPWVPQTSQFNILDIADWTKIKLYYDVDGDIPRRYFNDTYDMKGQTYIAHWTSKGITYKHLGLTLAFCPREDKDDMFFFFENTSQAIQHTKKYHWWQTLGEETHDLHQVDVSLEPYHFTMLQPIAGDWTILDWVAQHPVTNHAPLYTSFPIFVKPFFFQSCCVPDHSSRPCIIHRGYKQNHMS